MKNIARLLLVVFLIGQTTVLADSNLGIEDRATSYLIGDFETGRILEEYNIHEKEAIASVSKLMTYLVTMDAIKAGALSLEDRITITEEIENVGGSNFGLVEGEVLTIDQLLDGLMVVSGNDAAYALATRVAGSEKDFVVRMNDKAKELGLENTVFYNSSGLQEGENQNTMTTEEIFRLARHIIKEYPEVLEFSKIDVLSMPERNFIGYSTIPLVGEMPGVDGLKTGFTEEAGYCLVSTIDTSKTHLAGDFRLISIVMGTQSVDERRDLTKFLLEYGLDNYGKRKIIEAKVPYTEIEINSAKISKQPVYPKEDYEILTSKGTKYVYKSDIDENLKAPLEAGQKVGQITVYSDDEEIKTVDLVLKNSVEKAGFFTRMVRGIERLFSNFVGLFK